MGIVGGAAPHAPLVIGMEQAGMHRGRWWRLVDVVKKALPTVAVIQVPPTVPQRQKHAQPDDRDDLWIHASHFVSLLYNTP